MNCANILVEVKSESGKLTKDQEKFIDLWRGRQVVIVRNEHDVDNVLQRIITEQIPIDDDYD